MKNLLIYANPTKTFDAETALLVKIQIDNSLELGRKPQDFLLYTNFSYKYGGVIARPIPDSVFCTFRPLSTKTVGAAYLLETGQLSDKELHWVHDFDAYQMEPFTEADIAIGSANFAMTDYGWSPKWSLGSYFFKKSASDDLVTIRDTIYKYESEDERALVRLIKEGSTIASRIKKLNITYNFGMRHETVNYELADKPIKVLHFHPWLKGRSVLKKFMYGRNELGFPLMSKRLIRLFNKHGIK